MGEAQSNMTGTFMKKGRDTRDVYIQRKGHVRANEKKAFCKSRREASGKPKCTITLILDLKPPEW